MRIDAPTALSSKPLSAAKRRLLALLVASGPDGLTADQLADELGDRDRGMSGAALRMAVARLRDHLPDGWLPDGASGRYRLVCAPDAVDAWHLDTLIRTGGHERAPVETLLQLVRYATPFAGVDRSSMVDDASERLTLQQRELTAWMLEHRPDLVAGAALSWARNHCDDDVCNERLVSLVAARMAQVGDRRGALDLITVCRRGLREIGLDPSTAVADLEARLLDGTHLPPETVAIADRRAGQLPMRLRDHLQYAFVGDPAELDRAADRLAGPAARAVVLVEGVSGSGKTRWLSELALRATERSVDVVYVAGNEATVDGSLAPFYAALPGFAERAAAILDARTDPATRRASLWLALRSAIVPGGGHRQVLLVVDDVQWLDSQSLEFVAHAVADDALSVAVGARSDTASRAAWEVLRDAVVRAGAWCSTLAPMTADEIHEIVRSRFPGLSATTAWAVAREAHELSGGRPGMAVVLMASLDRDWQLPAPRALNVPHSLFGSLPDRLTPVALRLGAVAAVIGEQFDLHLAAQVAGMPIGAALDAADELVRHDLLIERNPTTFATAHALVDAAFLQALSRSELARLHFEASAILSNDVHRRARHLVEALPLADLGSVRQALLESARAYTAADLHLEASRRYRAVAELSTEPLSVLDAIAYSRALDLCGLHGEAEVVRSDAFRRALDAADGDLALRAATSGLPEAEPIDGAPTLVERLRHVPRAGLTRPAAWALEHQQARQLAIVGDLDHARTAASAAAGLAVELHEVVASALVGRFAISATAPPVDRLAILDSVAGLVAGLGPVIEGEYWLLRAIDLYEAGRRDDAVAAHATLRSIDQLPIVRMWHADLFESMVVADDGDAERARVLRRSAFDRAVRVGLREAEHAFLIGEFTELFLDGISGVLAGGVDDGSLDPTANTLMRAGVCAVLADADRFGEAVPHAETVARTVLASPVSQGVAALAYVAEALSRSTDRALVDRARAMLERRGGSAVIVGAGAASLGPIDRYAAMLAHEPESGALHAAALAFADASGVPRWRRVLSPSPTT